MTHLAFVPFSLRRAHAASAGLAVILGLSQGALAGTVPLTWNAAADFSAAANPSSPWSYGTRATSTGTGFSVLPNTFSSSPLVGWMDNAFSSLGTPAIYRNTSSSPVTSSTVTVAGNAMAMHPGPTGFGPAGMREFAVVRWTAPTSGLIAVTGSFLAFDSGATDVHLMLNGVSVFSAARAGGTNTPFSVLNLSIVAGDTLDFVVGNAGSFNNDTTGLDATIVIPTTSTAGAMALGMLAAVRRRRA